MNPVTRIASWGKGSGTSRQEAELLLTLSDIWNVRLKVIILISYIIRN